MRRWGVLSRIHRLGTPFSSPGFSLLPDIMSIPGPILLPSSHLSPVLATALPQARFLRKRFQEIQMFDPGAEPGGGLA